VLPNLWSEAKEDKQAKNKKLDATIKSTKKNKK